MNKGLIFFLGLTIGAGGGGFVAHTILKQQYAQKADEEIAACKNALLAKFDKSLEEKKAETKKEAVEAAKKYSTEPQTIAEILEEATDPVERGPYEISEEVYEDPSNPYIPVDLKYFPNEGVVVRVKEKTIMNKDDIEAAIGLKALGLFSDEDTQRVIIRNEKFQRDYEICLAGSMTYSEWKKKYTDAGK